MTQAEATNNAVQGETLDNLKAVTTSDYNTLGAVISAKTPLPHERVVTRAFVHQSHVVQRSIFDGLESRQPNTNGDIIYSDLPSQISEYDFRAYVIATQGILYDQSYKCKNEKDLTGVGTLELTQTKDKDGNPYRYGHIYVSLNELCRDGYGVPEGTAVSTAQRDNMRKAITVLDQVPIKIEYGNGDKRETYIIKKMEKFTRQSDGAEMYHLIPNPIFSTMEKGYGLMLRGTTTRLTEYLKAKGRSKAGKSAEMLAYWQLLSIQDRSKVWSISIENLLDRLGLTKLFKKNKKRVIAKLEEIFEAFYDLGFLLEKPATMPLDGVYRFKLNPDPKSVLGLKDVEDVTPIYEEED